MAIKPFRVSQINKYIGRILQADPILGNVSIIGEISNLKYHNTGHVYFSLKDSDSKISCFLPANYLEHIRFQLADGLEVIASGYVSVFERGGTYSLTVKDVMVEGLGNLDIAFNALKDKLDKEGLFDIKHKKKLPLFPEKIAVITSPTGAALRDIIKIITAKNDYVEIIVYPCLVQGPGAAREIADAIDSVNDLFPEVELIIAGRGGGSAEELWAFNEEVVARSIFASEIPIISAVGHETDFTIADFVADFRGETPTAAAQLAVPGTTELRGELSRLKKELESRLKFTVKIKETQLKQLNVEYLSAFLKQRIDLSALKTQMLYKGMKESLEAKLNYYQLEIEKRYSVIQWANPKEILNRGYGILMDEHGKYITSVSQIAKGDSLDIQLRDGSLRGRVEEVRKGNGKRKKE